MDHISKRLGIYHQVIFRMQYHLVKGIKWFCDRDGLLLFRWGCPWTA